MYISRALHDKGYTLIEVMIVISLMGLLSTFAVPNFKKTLDNYKLEVAVHELAQNIRLAQQKSISEGESYKILLGASDYQILLGRRGKLIKLPPGVFIDWTTYTEVNRTLSFKPTGAPNRGA